MSDPPPRPSAKDIAERAGVRDSFWDFLGLTGGRLILVPLGVVSSALTARILGRDGYGQVSLFQMTVGLVLLAATTWTGGAVLRFGREEFDERGGLHRTFWARNVILLPALAVALVAVYVFRGPITAYLQMPAWAVWLVVWAGVAGTGRGYVEFLLQAGHRLKTFAAAQVAETCLVIAGLTLVFVGLFERGYTAVLTVGLVASTVVATVLAAAFVPRRTFRPVQTDRSTLREVFRFSYPILLGNTAAYVVNYVDVMVIKQYFEMADVGGYQLAYNVYTLLTNTAGSALVLLGPMLISFVAARRDDLTLHYSRRLVPQALLVWSVMVGVGMGLAPLAFRAVYGEAFATSAVFFQFLAFGLCLQALTYLYSGLVTAYKLIRLAVIASLARAGVNLVGDLLLVPRLGPLGATYATAAGIAVAAFLYLLICQWKQKTVLAWQIGLIVPGLASLVACRLIPGWWGPVAGMAAAVVIGYVVAKATGLYRVEDIDFLEHIHMPDRLRRAITRVYRFLADGKGA